MVTKLTRLTQKIAIQLHLVAESCTIFNSRSRRPVWKLLDTPSYSIRVSAGLSPILTEIFRGFLHYLRRIAGYYL
jgi:hypothetical protein